MSRDPVVAVAGVNVGALAPETEALLSGNQAIARGAIEAGVTLAIGYPGAPASEAVEACLPAAGSELRVEWAVNEKVAFEIAAGVAWSGKRALCAMKMSGLNVAADSVLAVAASGVNGGLVLVVADDPSAYYGMVEQDSRYYALMGALPLLEPATPQEALDFTRMAFDVSERTGAPILLRTTTVLAQSVGLVIGRPTERTRVRGTFAFDPDRYTKAGAARCLAQHKGALARVREVGRLLEPLVKQEAGAGRTGAIGVGVAWCHLLEARARVAPDAPLLKLPASYPLPEKAVAGFLAGLERVLIVEELEPVVETAVRALAAHRPGLRVLGKLAAVGADAAASSGGVAGPANGALLSRVGEYDVDVVAAALASAVGTWPTAARPAGPVGSGPASQGTAARGTSAAASGTPVAASSTSAVGGTEGRDAEGARGLGQRAAGGTAALGGAEGAARSAAAAGEMAAVAAGCAGTAGRPPVFPAGCPHSGTYMALQQALSSLGLGLRDVVVTGDVGCAVLGALEPFSACATEVSMGASIGVAQGFAYAGAGKAVVAMIGDGSFFHAGLPALVGAVHRQVDLTLLVLDNGATCMTGGQAHPGSPVQADGTRQIRIEDVLRACQVRRVTVVDPYDLRRTATAIMGAVKSRGVSAVIARRACEAFLPEPPAPPLQVRPNRCVGVAACQNSCIAVTACPALQVDEAGKARIEASACVGCRLCEAVCPTRAIRRPWRLGAAGRGR